MYFAISKAISFKLSRKLALLSTLFFLFSSEGSQANIAKVYGRYLQENAKTGGAEISKEGPQLPTFKKATTTPRIRVRVQKRIKDVLVSGTDLQRKFHINNQTKVFKGRKAIKFRCGKLGRRTFKTPTLLASLGTNSGLLSLDEDKYNGLIHIVSAKDHDSCDVVHETNIETYISSLLSREMNAKWPVEALKAQAVAARTYAIHKMRSGQVKKEAGHETFYHLESSEKHQVSGTFFDVSMNTEIASQSTSGYVLVDEKGQINPIFFHAKCGGKTLRPEQVWKNKVTSYEAVRCPYCHDHGSKGYDHQLPTTDWGRFLDWAVRKGHLPKEVIALSKKEGLKIFPDKIFSRQIRFYLGEKVFSFKKALLRRYLGRFKVPSNNFELSIKKLKNGRGILWLKGEGLGHGVGMCQLGVLDLAEKGWDYERILKFYFPNHTLKRIY